MSLQKIEKKSRLPLVYRIVFENLRHRMMRTVLSAAAIGLGVAMILAIVGISQGMLEDQRGRARGVGAEIFLIPPGTSALALSSAPLSDKYVDLVREQPNVEGVTANVVQPIERVHRITGIDFDEFNAMANLQFVDGGPFEQDFDMILDEYYARENKLSVGDTYEMIDQEWRIVGIVQPGKMARMVVRKDILQELTGTTGKITMMYVKLKEPEKLNESIAHFQGLFKENMQVYSVEEIVSQFSADNVPEFQTFIKVIVGLSVGFGFLVIFLTMHTAVLERTKEIGILKSLGASSDYILGIFVREAFILGALGTLAGILASYLTREIISAFIPASIQQAIVPGWWPRALLVTLIGALLGVIYPAWKASRQDALESLGYE